MSWSDIRCLFCDGRLPLYAKLTSGQFCSPAHRKAYWAEQERLAIERLHQTHSSLRAVAATPETIEQILGQPAAPQEPVAPVAPDVALAPYVPPPPTRPAPVAVQGAPVLLPTPEPAGLFSVTILPTPDFSPDMVAADPMEYETALVPYRPLWSPDAPHIGADCFAPAIPMPVSDHVTVQMAPPADREVTPVFPRIPDPVRIGMHAPPQTVEFERWFDENIPPAAGPHEMPRIQIRSIPANILAEAIPVAMIEVTGETAGRKNRGARTRSRAARNAVMQLRLPIETDCVLVSPEVPMANRVPILSGQAVVPCQSNLSHIEPLEPRVSGNVAQFTLAFANQETHLRLARGCRYPVNPNAGWATVGVIESVDFPVVPPESSSARLYAAAASGDSSNVLDASGKNLLPLGIGLLRGAHPGVPHPVTKVTALPQSVLLEPIRPTTSRLEPLDDKPASDSIAPSFGLLGVEGPARKLLDTQVLQSAANFWKTAPRDLKILAIAIPVLLGLVLNPALPKVHVAAPTDGGLTGTFQKTFDARWGTVKQGVSDRAAIALNEDFRSGLDDWASRDDATATWSFDAAGFVSPATLALYRPSMGLADYQFQFLGMIEKKAISWIVRAADYDNYYVVKLTVLKPGPLPTIGLTRYAVVNGQADSRVDTLVPINAREDTLYRVLVDVNGDNFSVAVQGQMIDSWTETRLPRGGVGFYSSRGEESRVRWVQLTHQYDMLGRLCAFLAPYDPTTNGRWQ
jgi:hypothetical protein